MDIEVVEGLTPSAGATWERLMQSYSLNDLGMKGRVA